MIPFADEHPIRRFPWTTLALIAICIVVYFVVQPTGTPTLDWTGLASAPTADDFRFVVDNAAIPCELVQGHPLTQREFADTFGKGNASACAPDDPGREHSPGKHIVLAVLVTMFLHVSIAHLFGNMLFLWVFGAAVEERVGRLAYLGLYAVGGVVATAAHVVTDPNSTVPIIGASGAIAAVMGTYFVLWPRARIKTMIFFGPLLLRKVQAKWLLLIWLGTQLLLIGGPSSIAWAAHVGGFTFGVLIALLLKRRAKRAASAPAARETG